MSKQVGVAQRISVNTLLPLSAALLFVLGSATPAVPVVAESFDDGELEALRGGLATARAEVASPRERAEEEIEL